MASSLGGFAVGSVGSVYHDAVGEDDEDVVGLGGGEGRAGGGSGGNSGGLRDSDLEAAADALILSHEDLLDETEADLEWRRGGGGGSEMPPVVSLRASGTEGQLLSDADRLGGTFGFTTYSSRWGMLFIFSLLSFVNAMLWVSFASIQQATSKFYTVTTFWVNMLSMSYMILYIPGVSGGDSGRTKRDEMI